MNTSTPVFLFVIFLQVLVHKCEGGCGEGKFNTNNGCETCPIGTYNQRDFSRYCNSCPPGYTTNQPGSTFYSQCRPTCGRGYQSEKVGKWYFTQQCVICSQGSYSDTDNADSCTQCPNGQITSREGSTSASDCLAGRTCVNGCPPLSVLFGEVSYNRSAVGGRYPVGTRGTYACDDSKESGSTSRICQQSGVWNGSPAVCRRTCQPLSEENLMNLHTINYNKNSVNGRYRRGTKAVYECDNGYSVAYSGWRTRVCQWTGVWDGFIADCKRGCRPIWGDNAYRSYDKTKFGYGLYPYGTRATSSCQGGYENKSGWRVRTCQNSGEWTGYPYRCG